jgi:hypothetical protein
MQMQFRVVRLSGWRAVVAVLAGLIGLVAVVALLAVGFVFVVLPGIVIATIAYWFLPKPKVRAMGPTGDPHVIEGTFEVAPDDADRKRLEQQTPP